MKEFHIGNKFICNSQPCYIIAEIGLNHNGKEGLVFKMIEEAAKAGVDAIKLSRFNTQKLLSKSKNSLKCLDDTCGYDEDVFQQYDKLELSKETLAKVAQYCTKMKLDFLSTAFDEESVNFLVEIGVPAIKIASGDLTLDPFLKYVAGQNLPVILSTGMSSLDEVKQAVNVLVDNGCIELALLHCVSDYPAKKEDLNLRAISILSKEFNMPIGFSDHTTGIEAIPVAVASGACIVEKHFTLNKELPGPDHRFSADPYELTKLIKEIRRVELMLGVEQKDPTPAELEFRKFGRRSIVAKTSIEPDTVVTEEMLAMKRPGTGISPRDLYKVLGKKTRVKIDEDEILTWDKIY